MLAASGFLYSTEFDTESHFDVLTVDGERYSGPMGPNSVAVAVNGSMQMSWHSDPS